MGARWAGDKRRNSSLLCMARLGIAHLPHRGEIASSQCFLAVLSWVTCSGFVCSDVSPDSDWVAYKKNTLDGALHAATLPWTAPTVSRAVYCGCKLGPRYPASPHLDPCPASVDGPFRRRPEPRTNLAIRTFVQFHP